MLINRRSLVITDLETFENIILKLDESFNIAWALFISSHTIRIIQRYKKEILDINIQSKKIINKITMPLKDCNFQSVGYAMQLEHVVFLYGVIDDGLDHKIIELTN